MYKLYYFLFCVRETWSLKLYQQQKLKATIKNMWTFGANIGTSCKIMKFKKKRHLRNLCDSASRHDVTTQKA